MILRELMKEELRGYQLVDTTNRNLESGDAGLDHLSRMEITRPFR